MDDQQPQRQRNYAISNIKDMCADIVAIANIAIDFEPEYCREDNSRQQFNQKIPSGEPRAAPPAFPTQQPITDERDIVVPSYRLQTRPAPRSERPKNTLLHRDAGN